MLLLIRPEKRRSLWKTYSSGGDQKRYYVEVSGTGLDTEVTHELTVREDTITNRMPQLTVNKQDMSGKQLAGAIFKLTGEDGVTALIGYGNIESTNGASGNLLNGIYLSNGIYYLVETEAPDGYNKLEYKVKIVVSGDSAKIITAATAPESTMLISDQTDTNSLVYTFVVNNNSGCELPSNGGIGTTWYYIPGFIVIALAGAVLVWRRRRYMA